MPEKLTAAQARERVAELEDIIRDTLWMARRYAHGRQSYAVGMYNDAARRAERAGLTGQMPDGSIYALDGTQDGIGGAEMSGLSQTEFDAAAAALNAKGITHHPGRFSPAGLAALKREQGDADAER